MNIAVLALLLALAVTVGTTRGLPAVALAASAGSGSTAQKPSAQSDSVPALKAGWIACEVHSDNPHYSNGSRGVIAKDRGTCTRYGVGLASTVKVGLKSTITLNGALRASRTGTFSIATDSKEKTYYVPASGNAGTGRGKWVLLNTVTSVSPAAFATGIQFGRTVNGYIGP
jgi:hypothetical protein